MGRNSIVNRAVHKLTLSQKMLRDSLSTFWLTQKYLDIFNQRCGEFENLNRTTAVATCGCRALGTLWD